MSFTWGLKSPVKSRDSLIRRINSLMTRFNSLLGPNKFPVPMRRELARKSLNLALDAEPTIHSGAPVNKIPCIFPASREFGFRDEFAQDCLLHRRVQCEPDFLDQGRSAKTFLLLGTATATAYFSDTTRAPRQLCDYKPIAPDNLDGAFLAII